MKVALFLALVAAMTTALPAQDVIYLKTGESLACRVDDLTDNIVNFSLLSNAGTAGGTARRTVPAELVDYIEFDFREGEAAFFERRHEATSEQLKGWWDFFFPHLHRARSRAAAYGIAFAGALLREAPDTAATRALSIFDRIIERAWSADDVALAKQGRLRALMALGDLETATVEARLLASQTEDPGLLIEVNYLLAMADFQKLKDLQEEHPRWVEDDEVRPERNEIYHRAVDQFLWPHLFHATREEVAARGLAGAAGLYLFAGEIEAARARWGDLIQLYPGTTFATEAKTLLETHPSPTTAPTEPQP
jgi:tetratricopeptide (TPR) repeat protein